MSVSSAVSGLQTDVHHYVVAALTLVVGMAWNAAFERAFAEIGWLRRWGPFAYAVLLTVIAALALAVLRRRSA